MRGKHSQSAPKWRAQNSCSEPGDCTVESPGKDAAEVVEHKSVRMVTGLGLPKLLQGPLRCRLGGPILVENLAAFDLHGHEDLKGAGRCRQYKEEIASSMPMA